MRGAQGTIVSYYNAALRHKDKRMIAIVLGSESHSWGYWTVLTELGDRAEIRAIDALILFEFHPV